MGKYFIPRVKIRQLAGRTRAIGIKCMRLEKNDGINAPQKIVALLIYVSKSFHVRDSALIDYLNSASRCIMQSV